MKTLTLKNARRLETTIDSEIARAENRINSLSRSGSSSIKKETAIANTIEIIDSACNRIDMLMDIKYDIRDGISKFNQESGINDLCIQIAKLSKQHEIATMKENIPLSEETHAYSYSKNDATKYGLGITYDLREQYHIDAMVIERKLRRLKDKCAGINGAGKINLTDEQYTYLQQNGLLD